MQAKSLGELAGTEHGREPRRSRSVKDEMRANLIRKLESGETVFPGIVGYEETVVPHVVNAILSRHNMILLGLRGQAKSRILRQLVSLLDDAVPVIAARKRRLPTPIWQRRSNAARASSAKRSCIA
jgi:magnesium chelatase subunit I